MTKLPALTGMTRSALGDTGSQQKGRHKSTSKNATSNSSRLRAAHDQFNSQSMRKMSRKQAEMLGIDIEQQPLNVNIESSDIRMQSNAKASKLPHLMAHK